MALLKPLKLVLSRKIFYGAETNKALSAVSSTKALFTAVLPIYKTFTRKKKPEQDAGIILWSDPSIVRAAHMRRL